MSEEEPKSKPKDDDMAADIAELKARIAQLEQANEQLTTDYNAALEELSVQLDASEQTAAQVQAFETEKGALTAKVRTLAAKQAYDKVAAELGIKEGFRDDVWEIGKYVPDKDDIDPNDVKMHFSKLLESRKDYLESADKPARLPKGEGSDRGRGTPETDGKFRATEAQLNNMDWMERNMASIAKASESGGFEITPD